jgi:hypothetical protein
MESEHLAGKVDLRHFNVFQDSLGNSDGPNLIGISVRVVNLCCMLAVARVVKMARLDDDAAEGEHVAATFIGRVDPERFVAEINDRGPVLQRLCGLGVDVVRVDAKVVLSGKVPSVERHICVPVGGGDVIWIRHVWTHSRKSRPANGTK